MRKHNPNNERIKRKYLTFLKQAKGQNESSIDAVAKAVSRFESYNNYKDFKAFHFEQAINFKKHLAKQQHHKTGQPLSLATLNSTARHLKVFIQWLSQESGYKSRISYSDAEYFNLSEKETRTATAKRQKAVATIDQIKHVLRAMPISSVIEKRNKALIAFTLLTGARDSAIASIKLKHVDVNSGTVYQDAREVNTKSSKTFATYFFPVGNEIRDLIVEWVSYLQQTCGFSNDDPLFPKTKIIQGKSQNFEVAGITKDHWSNASAIRKIFKEAFAKADLPYFNPHSFRNTLAIFGETICKSPEQFKAWSQNLGHEGVLTTLYSYGEVQTQRQAEIIQQLNSPCTKSDLSADELAEALIRQFNAQNNG